MSRRARLEGLLQDDPHDSFLRYALALDYLKEGDRDEARRRLTELAQQDPLYVATYFQLGQLLATLGDTAASRELLEKGIRVANQAGDGHAASEMQGLLASLTP